MFYHIFDYLEQFDFPGAGMFQYITFRSACAVILSLLIATVVGKRIIRICRNNRLGRRSGTWDWKVRCKNEGNTDEGRGV